MPRVNPDGRIVKLEILPHYLEMIRLGKKVADIRKLDSRWLAIVSHAEYIQFNCSSTGEGVEVRLLSVTCLNDDMQGFYADLDLAPESDKYICAIKFEANNISQIKAEERPDV